MKDVYKPTMTAYDKYFFATRSMWRKKKEELYVKYCEKLSRHRAAKHRINYAKCRLMIRVVNRLPPKYFKTQKCPVL